MRTTAGKTAGLIQLRRRLIRELERSPRKLSTYRMFRSKEFQELCEFYLEGIGIRRFEQFREYAMQLESTFERRVT